MEFVLAGVALGVIVGAVVGRWRGRHLGVAYGALSAGAVWACASYVASSRAHEMAALPYGFAFVLALSYVIIPALIAVLVLELRRARAR